MKLKQVLLASVMAIGCVSAAHAQLGTTLTDFGGIKAASADGAVPAYTGGLAAATNLPAGSPTTGYPDPYASDQPVFSVTNANAAQYASLLTPGEQALLNRYGSQGYRLDVYPTHRSFSYPAWVLQNTVKEEGTAQEVPNADGVAGSVYGAIPFPEPKDGAQVLWNSYLQYVPPYCQARFQNYLVDTSGAVTELGTIGTSWNEPYYNQAATAMPDTFYRYYKVRYYSPAAEAGQLFLFKYPENFTISDEVTYFYSPGTRRVRLAPEFKYDTPISSYGGAINYDEIDLLKGRFDHWNLKLVGEKELIVPYNDYKYGNTTESAALGPHFLNPDGVRWERHRVWIVDATLKDGARHAFSRWTFYVDEDSWHILATESYDHANNIYKVGFAYPWENYSQGDAASFAHTFGIYDLSKGSYELSYAQAQGNGFYQCSTTAPNGSEFTPQAMAAEAIR